MQPEDYDHMPLNCPNLYQWWHDLEFCDFCVHIERNRDDNYLQDEYSDISSDMSDEWTINSCESDLTIHSNNEEVGSVDAEFFYHDEEANCAESQTESTEENLTDSITFDYFKQILESINGEGDVARSPKKLDEKEEEENNVSLHQSIKQGENH